jgi:molecular chaperone DnaK
MATVGIDLGTTYSAIAKVNELGKPEIIPNQEGSNFTPSVIFFESAENIVVGQIAKDSAELDPHHVVQFVKNYMGKSQTWEFFGRAYIPEKVSAKILSKLIYDAEEYLDEPITRAVITVPAIFGERERTATKEAAKEAGLKNVTLLSEPVAAAVSYGFGRAGEVKETQTVLVYDLGGGTFDITVIQVNANLVKVLHTDGDRLLGGKLWDDEIIKYVAECFQSEHGVDPRESLETLQDIRNRAEQAKKALSQREECGIVCNHAGKALQIKLTRSKFEEMTADQLERTKVKTERVVQQLVTAGKLKGWQDIHQVLLVGGSSKMPQVTQMMQQLSGQAPKLYDPDLAVAKGAALYALMQVIIEAEGDTSIIEEETSISPDSIPELVRVADVCSFAVGVESHDSKNHQLITNKVIIPKNTELPAQETQQFRTMYDNQTSIPLPILEGDDPDPEDCIRLGEVYITGIPKGLPKGSLIEITIELTDESLIKGTAIEKVHNTTCVFEIRRNHLQSV